MDHRLRTGHLAALAGALATGAALWLPWYEIRLGELARGALGSQAQNLPPGLGEFARGLMAVMPESVTGSGWQTLRGADAALVVGAVLVAALVLAAAGALGPGVRVDSATAGRIIGALGVAGTVIVAQHILSPPGPGELVHVRGGLWVALAGTVLTAAAGFSTGAAPRGEATAAAAPPAFSFTVPIDDVSPLEPARASVAPPSQSA